MKKITMRLIALALLTMFSMGAAAKIDVQIAKDGKFDGGTIVVKGQEEQKEGGVKVTITVSPNSGYTIKKEAIEVYATYPPSGSRADTRDIEIASNLTLLYNGSEKEDVKDASAKRDYTFIVPSGFGAWIKEAKFSSGSKGDRSADGYSGVYYIASVGYDGNKANTNNYYLCPTKGWCSYKATDDFEAGDNNPFLTTYKCKTSAYTDGANNAIWTIEKAPAPNSDYYYIKQASTGKYLTSNGTINTTGNADRMRVHLETVAPENLDDKELFTIAEYSTYLTISPKGVVGGANNRNWLTVNGGNKNALTGQSGKTGGPTGYANTAGIIGVYTQDDANAPFYLEKALSIDSPTITNNFDGTITITADGGAAIYYTTDGSTPTMSSSVYSTAITLTDDITVIKAIAKAASDPFPTTVTTYELPVCERPVISVSGGYVTITCATEGATIYYTTDGNEATSSSTPYAGPFAKGDISTIRAIAIKTGYANSSEATLLPPTEVSSSDEMTDMSGNYILASNFSSASSIGTSENPFKGTIDGNLNTLTLGYPLVAYADGATIKNVILDNVSISSGNENGNAGAICCEATGDTRIYNCGVLATASTANTDEDGYTYLTSCSSTVSGSNYVGGIVGLLDGSARVINCFSYANVSGGSYVGGIVGYNNVATTATNLKTMVMNCMFYGEVSGSSIAPIYNGKIITNVGENTGVSNYNYFRLESSYIQNTTITKVYNCALGAETRFLQRFEFFRHLLNSHRELAAWWATGSMDNKDEMMKWVLEPAQIGSSAPFPILKAPGYYPSVVNIDAENAPTTTERNTGGKLGKLSVTIQEGSGAVFSAPTGASITKRSLTLNITDKDFDHFNFNYYKVQLPYYNDVGTGNYTGNRVVTGWKIVSVTTDGSVSSYNDFTMGDDAPAYNFADRKCTNKDLYSESGRVFNQGAYWDVPEGVTGITIQPYWAKAAYVADAYPDVVYNTAMDAAYNVPYVGGGEKYIDKNNYDIAGQQQKVYTTVSAAVGNLNPDASHTIHDYAVVLVGNVHQYTTNNGNIGSKKYTVTTIDLDHDNEPDYSFMLRNDGRNKLHPAKWDFLNIVGLGMAQKSTGGTGSYNQGIFQPLYWFESTNTSLFRVTQFEYDNSSRIEAPLILQGGVMEQWVSGQSGGRSNNTTYFHVGGNVWFKEFHRGTHQDQTYDSKHPPVSVTGGDYNEFYLTGLYTANVDSYADNAECYINGGRFGVVAGAAMEGIGKADGADNTGNITWQVQNADIKEFYAGGINAAKPVTGNLSTTITGGKIDLFCGGPKFGDMSTGKTVTTNATNCIFGTFFGAGYGGNSYSRQAPRNHNNMINFPHNDSQAGNDASWNAWLGRFYTQTYNSTYGGVSTQFSYQFLPMSQNKDNCGRIFVEYVKFSLATCRNVTSTLTGCQITGNFYGGGSLGKVDGPVTSTLTNCNVQGNVFGAGFSASLPSVEVDATGFTTEPYYYSDLGTYREGVKGSTTTYTWQKKTSNSWVDNTNHILYTDEDLTALGTVTGKATLNIEGTTTVGHSVYGGGEESGVGGDTEVNVTRGTIGTQGQGGVEYGNVYGGGKGKVGDKVAGYVKGNTTVNISQASAEAPTTIYHNVYGGGAYGSVGDFTYDASTGMPTACSENTGSCTVNIKSGTFGWNGKENGMVFGSSRGDVAVPGTDGVDPNDRMAWVYSTHVTIGDANAETSPTVKGSVYGSGENGHTFQNTIVDINKGIIGITTGEPITDNNGTPDDTSDDTTYSGALYPFRGNVYGGGCGTDMYDSNNDGTKDKYNPLAGIVRGTATVNITGGQVVHNVYGAGAMGSVGNADDADSGKTTINISGGRIGYTGERDGNVFGAARGEFGKSTAASGLANVRETEVNINYTTTPTADNEGKTAQLIAGSVFGGGEAGTVKESVAVNMTGGLVLKDVYGGGALADTQTSNWDASANENAGDWANAGQKSALHTTTVRLTGGRVGEEVYGGGLGEAGKPAYVWGDVLVDLNGTTSSGETGSAIAVDAKGCAVGQIFGCNNVNGTPKGDVMVHVYATQNAAATQIANASEVTTAKVKGRYDVTAVYGGGNMAAYDPVTPHDGTSGSKTKVIIEGCSLTSIETVYGGGNAAAVPETDVYIKSAYEIGYLFGGGNGKDDIAPGVPNPGADVGTPDHGTTTYGTGNANTLMEGGLIHEAYGGSNTKGIIKGSINQITDPKYPEDPTCCELAVEKIVGAGKYADVDGDVNMTLSCQPERKVTLLFAGADEANVNGNITLNVTNGHFGKVFGGNNLGGVVKGKITVNVKETDCQPIKIDDLYLGGNEAAYSVFGYYESEDIHPVTGKKILKPRTSADDSHTPVDNPATDETHTFPYKHPELNIISCTYIGNVFGGGLGEKAVMYANPTVNVNMVPGRQYANDETVGVPKVMEGLGLAASENPDKLGIIENVYGGGDAANIEGNTTVNIATETGKGAYIIGNVFGGGNGVMDNLDLGKIIGNTHVIIGDGTDNANVIIGDGTDNANLHIKCSAYGGGNIGMVTGNTVVDVNNGIIGTNQKGGYKWGNVYGGGKGKIVETEGQSAQLVMNSIADVDAGLVKGNTTITINGTATTTQILHNVYGGGAVGSVGTFTRDETTGLPTACADNTGLTTVTINGGTIGHDRKDTGMVNGSSRGWEGNPEGSYLNQLAWVNNTNVIIGDASSDAGPSILGSVYGGGENGHNFKNGVVTVNKGTIGYEEGTWDCGNIYGAGCGTDTYTIGESTTEHHNPMAGCVRGTTSITVNGGNILRNVYGGGSMGSVGGGTTADAGKTTIAINGGTIGETNTDYGHVFGGPKGNLSETEFSASVWETQVNINTGADIKGSVFGGGEAGIVKGSVVVNMKGGEVAKDVYGGGALASTNTESGATVVNLTGGHIKSDVYGGGLGQIEVKEDDVIKKPGIAATVGTTTVNLNENVDDGSKGCVVEENIFGCNNQNGTPLGDVTVHIYKTQRNGATRITNTDTDKTAKVKGTKTNGEYDPSSFDIKAVYGGGNLSAYEPTDLENSKANVIIDGCERTSICQVYGGGNAASTPASNVTVNGTFEIGELFGGGNGLDDILINGVTMPNPGANVGYKDYSEYYKDGETWKVRDKEDADTKEKRTGSSYVYGTGKASVNIFGGTIHRVFGGSNTKGNVRQTAVTLLDEAGGCEFCVDEAYGGGKSAEMDAEAQLLMACIPGLQAVYGGAEAADVRGNVTLNITNGTFDRVFGGNNVSGTISGAITINVEEIGCKPVKIGQLYGGGNLAGYSVYGYDSGGQPKETGDRLYDDPQINVMSFTSIGNIYGGGYGNTAVMVGNPTVNVNEVYGKYYNDDVSVVGENAKTPNGYPIPSHAKGKMGAISEIFGGGNAAKVIGNTTVNIGTQSEVYVVKQVTSGATLPDGCYTRNDDGTYDSATGTASADITYYEKKDVLGADIRGNVYGGGNEAEVTGNTEVVIGQRKE